MASLAFGNAIDKEKDFQKNGYDMFETGMGEVLGATAAEAWKFSPWNSISRYNELNEVRAGATDSPLIPKDDLNKKYSNDGLYFYEDEKQEVVDLLLERKQAERRRQEIIAKGPTGILPGAAKLGVSFVTSAVDPINLASAFIPIVGQARFASMVARAGGTARRAFTTARFKKGAIEGTVGAAAVEPIVYGVAQSEQADYGLMDSFMAISFGTVLGGGLHVGVGKLKDFNTRKKFEARIREAKSKAGVKNIEETEVNLYREYYPEHSEVMRGLAKTDPDTRTLLLAKAMDDIAAGKRVDVEEVAMADPVLRKALINDKTEGGRIKTDVPDNDIKIKNPEPTGKATFRDDFDTELDSFNNSKQVDLQSKDLDIEVENKILELDSLKQKQKDLGIEEDIKTRDKEGNIIEDVNEVERFNAKEKEIKDSIIDGINCLIGK